MRKLITKTTTQMTSARRPLANFTVPRHYLMSVEHENNAKTAHCPIYQKDRIQEINQVHREP